MKTYKILLLSVICLLASNCSLEEEPPYLANVNVYNSAANAATAVQGIYSTLVGYDYYGHSFMQMTFLNSGFSVTRRQGNNNNSVDNATLASLKSTSNDDYLRRSWSSIYSMIARCNDALASMSPSESPSNPEELGFNDAIGQAYFLRAFNYFNLVRLWGEVPLRLRPADTETFNLAKSSIPTIYNKIIEDTKAAQKYLNGTIGNGTVKVYAADMLLAKVYMTLATAPASQVPASADYWQLAYNEAIKVYGKYSLVSNYDNLFRVATANNTTEAIFEIKSSVAATLDHTRAFTPNFYTQANTFGFCKVNVPVYDRHVSAYRTDPRIGVTYIARYTNTGNGNLIRTYPDILSRNNFQNATPYLFKLGSRDPSNNARETTQGFKVYRYADLLLMLAEISNELQNGQQLGYVTEVLRRVGLNPRAAYTAGQASFRDAIMEEYAFELLAEGHDWFNNRRRGYTYFLNKVILPHNNFRLFNPNIDVTLNTVESEIMFIPIAQDELNSNTLIGTTI